MQNRDKTQPAHATGHQGRRFFSCRAFSLLEVLVGFTIVFLLAAALLLIVPGIKKRAQQTASLNNLRQLGTAMRLYASENDGSMPSRTDTPGLRWPTLLLSYLNNDPRVYAEPGSDKNYIVRNEDPESSFENNTSYVINGFNDLGTYDTNGNSGRIVKIIGIERPSETILFAVQEFNPGNFYMDVALDEHNLLFKPEYTQGGSNYLFVDGSARHLKKSDYDHQLWLADKTYQLQ